MPAARPALDAPLTLADLRKALEVKERELRELIERKEQIAGELDELGETLQAMLAGGAAAPGRKRAGNGESAPAAAESSGRRVRKVAQESTTLPRAGREGSLPTFIRAVLEQVVGPLRVAEIVEAVQQAGYASKSDNLGIIVSNRLAQMDDVERVERGLYQLRRGADAPAS
ncbi:MAG: hypothetical protein JNL90_06085 [Planctomycetes bacterium]|nr:hypothetical protein [Planctomycetota bacterium]